jgi:hypothetical protein
MVTAVVAWAAWAVWICNERASASYSSCKKTPRKRGFLFVGMVVVPIPNLILDPEKKSGSAA